MHFLLKFPFYITTRFLVSFLIPNYNFSYNHKMFHYTIFSLCDFYIAHYSKSYFTYSLFCPLDQSSFENFLIFLSKTTQFDSLQNISLIFPILCLPSPVTTSTQSPPHISPYQLPYAYNHFPCLNLTWFYHINTDIQYSTLTSNLMILIQKYFTFINPKYFLLFKPRVTFLNYLLFLSKNKNIPLFFTIYITFTYYYTQFNQNVIINTNFIMGFSIIFTLMYICI